jgi:radical SAM protein with 4Fe4S-binding SPASM domain
MSDSLEYWVLGELNIFKKSEDDFDLMSGNGSLLSLDREASIAVLTMNGPADFQRWEKDLSEYDIKPEKTELKKILSLMQQSGLVETKPMKMEKMDYKKVIKNTDKFEHGPLGISNVVISTTSACLYDCIYCLRQPMKIGKQVEKEFVYKTMEDISQLGCRLVTFSGGEPGLVKENLKQYIKFARDRGIRSRALATRGYNFDRDTVVELKNMGLTDVVVSLDSGSEMQDQISRYKGAFSIALSALQSAKDVGLRTAINLTYFGQGLEEIEKVSEIVKKLGIRMKVTPLVPRGNLKPLSPEETIQLEKHVERLSNEGYNVACIASRQQYRSYDTPMICEAGIARAHVEADGDVSGCQFVGYIPDAIAGNIQDGFLNVWLNGNWSFYREAPPINEKCGACNDRKYCISNCLAMADVLFGQPKMINTPPCNK